jgi:hypothetical protein
MDRGSAAGPVGQPGALSSIRALHVYFPGSEQPINLKIDHTDEPGELFSAFSNMKSTSI